MFSQIGTSDANLMTLNLSLSHDDRELTIISRALISWNFVPKIRLFKEKATKHLPNVCKDWQNRFIFILTF